MVIMLDVEEGGAGADVTVEEADELERTDDETKEEPVDDAAALAERTLETAGEELEARLDEVVEDPVETAELTTH